MPVGRGLTQRLAALVALAACAGAAGATTPSLLWNGAKRVGVNCLVQSGTAGDTAALEAALCDRVRSLATRKSPIPVQVVQPGDRAFVEADTVLLLVHASVERTAGGRTFAFTIRPHRPSGGDAEVFFGTAPRAVAAAAVGIGPAVEAGLDAALAEVLPWQHRPEPRPI